MSFSPEQISAMTSESAGRRGEPSADGVTQALGDGATLASSAPAAWDGAALGTAPAVPYYVETPGFDAALFGILASASPNDAQIATSTAVDVGGEIFTCTVCRKVFKREMNLVFHMTTHGPRSTEAPESVDSTNNKCQDCGKVFATKYQAKKHYLRRHFSGDKPFPCTKCNKKRFVVREDLTMHMKSCGSVYICKCGIRLCSLGALKRHCKYFEHEPRSLEPEKDPTSRVDGDALQPYTARDGELQRPSLPPLEAGYVRQEHLLSSANRGLSGGYAGLAAMSGLYGGRSLCIGGSLGACLSDLEGGCSSARSSAMGNLGVGLGGFGQGLSRTSLPHSQAASAGVDSLHSNAMAPHQYQYQQYQDQRVAPSHAVSAAIGSFGAVGNAGLGNAMGNAGLASSGLGNKEALASHNFPACLVSALQQITSSCRAGGGHGDAPSFHPIRLPQSCYNPMSMGWPSPSMAPASAEESLGAMPVQMGSSSAAAAISAAVERAFSHNMRMPGSHPSGMMTDPMRGGTGGASSDAMNYGGMPQRPANVDGHWQAKRGPTDPAETDAFHRAVALLSGNMGGTGFVSGGAGGGGN